MANGVYITSAEGNTGKTTIALGLVTALRERHERVGVFRPVVRSLSESDLTLELLLSAAKSSLDPVACIGVTYEDVHADPDAALATIIARYRSVLRQSDVVVIVGSDYTDVSSPTELSFNARIATNLGAPVILALGGRIATPSIPTPAPAVTARSPEELAQVATIAVEELHHEHADLLAIVANRVEAAQSEAIVTAIREVVGAADVPMWTIPEVAVLAAPTLRSVMLAIDGALFAGDPSLLHREVMTTVIAAMSMENVLPRLTEGAAVIIPADRTEVLLAVLLAQDAGTFPSLSGIVLNGGFPLSPQITRLLQGLRTELPIITTNLTTWETAVRMIATRGRLSDDSPEKVDRAQTLFAQNVAVDDLLARIEVTRATVVTPRMFEFDLIERARSERQRIVLPEGGDDRILLAAHELIARDVADLTILGDADAIQARADALGIDLAAATILAVGDDAYREEFAAEYARLRAHKGVTIEQARDKMRDPSYFATMLVQRGIVDGMVSGATHTTADTIRPAFEIIKTEPGVALVSSVFFMCLEDRVLVYGDCAINPNPTAEQLADIAISSAKTAAQFGVEPRVAMLSYSTGTSGAGADVEQVRIATDLVRERWPELPVEGPIQYDAAADLAVAATKLPQSTTAGRATVFIFPDLNTGNNTYKAVQRSAGAVAIGPVLQGLRKPVNDLSRGALVADIVNTVAITAIQAQGIAQEGTSR